MRKKIFIGGLFSAFILTLLLLITTHAADPDMLDRYTGSKIKILIVPGHDDDPASGGGRFKNLIEANLNLQLSEAMIRMFEADPHFEVITTRDINGYKEPFASYFRDQYNEIISFRADAIANTKKLISTGLIRGIISPAPDATPGASIKLYGINKWINENGADLALHVHFNDYGGRRYGQKGRYSGLVMFIPESQLPNHEASISIAKPLFENLKKYFPISNNPIEWRGLVEDQELIAVGGRHTLKDGTAAMLIEYGYIYESAWFNTVTRDMIIKEIAYQTYAGIKKSFEPSWEYPAEQALARPYVWSNQMKISPVAKTEVLALQIALTKAGLYPPPEFYRNDCPMSGLFGRCTRKSILKFQELHKLPITGFADNATLRKLNDVYRYSLPELSDPL